MVRLTNQELLYKLYKMDVWHHGIDVKISETTLGKRSTTIETTNPDKSVLLEVSKLCVKWQLGEK